MNPLGVLVLFAGILLLYLGIKGKQSAPGIRQLFVGNKPA